MAIGRRLGIAACLWLKLRPMAMGKCVADRERAMSPNHVQERKEESGTDLLAKIWSTTNISDPSLLHVRSCTYVVTWTR